MPSHVQAKNLRARRRQEREKRKARARQLFPGDAKSYRLADNLTTCSGPCCGNPRRWFGELTIQERREARPE